jgi:RNA polymerase sigma factor (sigma-70 family)
MKEDSELLRDYVRNGAEDAFAELVRRRLGLVYRVALRKVNGDVHLAEEVTQGVFADLARKAARLAERETLAGWLFTSAHFAATKAVRSAERRRHREQKAQIMMNELSGGTAAATDWDSLRPLLDDLMQDLPERDREAVLLRFYEEKDYEEIGKRLRLSSNGARSRIERALEKIRTALAGRGIASTEAAVIAALGTQSAFAAPAGLVSSVTTTALAHAGSGVPLTAAAFLMNKTLLIGAVALLALGFGLYQRTQSRHWEDALRRVDRSRAELQTKLAAAEERGLLAERQLAALQRERSMAATERQSEGTAASVAPVQAPSLTSTANATSAERSKLHERYDPFLVRFGLTAEQRDRFVELKLLIAETQKDLQAAVEESGAQGGTAGVEALRSQATKSMWDEINQLLGPAGTEAYRDYEQTSAFRSTLVDRFTRAGVSISDEQMDQVAHWLIQTKQTYREKPTDMSLRYRLDWGAVARNAEGILTPAQVAVIRAQAN